jgi:hypothetical protein
VTLAVGFALLGMSVALAVFAFVRHLGLRGEFLALVPADLSGRNRRKVAEAIRFGRVPVNPELADLTLHRARELVHNFPLRLRELQLIIPAIALFTLAWVDLVPRIAVASLVTATILITWRFVRLTRDRNNAQRILEDEHHIRH